MKVLGMMSGTSVDSVDGAIVEIEGDGYDLDVKLLFFGSYPFPEALRSKVNSAMSPSSSDVRMICELNFELGKFYAEAARKFAEDSGLEPQLIANHGQTVYHIPMRAHRHGFIPSTLQLGEPSFMALELGVPVVSDFRPADIAAGGEGAPLVPMADYILFRSETHSRAIHNIGGISNLTFIPANASVEDIVAFDTGPGNTLIDNAMMRLFGREYDVDGMIAAKGKVNRDILNMLMHNDYFDMRPPKSTGREEFNLGNLPPEIWKLRPEDIIATLTAFTAESIADAYQKFVVPLGLDEIYVGGGGAENPVLMQMLRDRLFPIPVYPLSMLGIEPKAREAVAFAILGYLTFNGMAGNVPAATGASRPVVLGRISYPAGGFKLTPKA